MKLPNSSTSSVILIIVGLVGTVNVDATIPWYRRATHTSVLATTSMLRGVRAGRSTVTSWSGDRCHHGCVGVLAVNNRCTRQ
jgi:hypothetical protein